MASDPYLSPSVEDLLARICTDQSLPPPDYKARVALAEVGEAAAFRILWELSSQRIRSFSAYILFKCKNSEAILARNGDDIATQESACFSGPRTPPHYASSRDDAASEVTSPPCGVPPVYLAPPPPSAWTASFAWKALGEVEFRKAFLILS